MQKPCVVVCMFVDMFWVFPVLVPVCPFPFSPFASFACFCWALKALIFVPCVLPSTSRPSASPALLCRFCVFYMHGVAECSSATPTCAPPIRILVTHHALRSPHPLYRPYMSTLGIHWLSSPTHYARYECCSSFLHNMTYCACTHVLCVCLRVSGCFPSAYVLTFALNPFAYVVVTVLALNSLVR